ncbi:MAG: nicotinate phosphoribosyltransferase [Actinomycetota bacterium]|nr:nicotinate phosphoribosyltransferase [Actinomycetota bacterium]
MTARPEPDGPLGLFTDLYELRMAQTCLTDDMTASATFSLYVRPAEERPWLLAAGTQRALDFIEAFGYGPEEIDYLAALGLSDELLGWLLDLEPSGEVWAVADGTLVLANEPLLEVTAPLPFGMLLETGLMNVVQFPTLVATKAARCVLAARGRGVVDFGFRRAHGLEAGVEAARAAYLGGLDSTSNVEAGRRFGIPVSGTMAHSFVQAYADEVAAFRGFAADHPGHSVMLVDTYDTLQGVQNAIRIADVVRERGAELSGVRLDSGDLAALAKESRRLLDESGLTETKIFASGGIDEWVIASLVAGDAPIDAFGVGTSLTVSNDHPALDIAYKLVEYDGSPSAKYSEKKATLPGAKQVFRDGTPVSDLLATRDEDARGERLLAPIWRDGETLCRFDLEQARSRAATQLESLPDEWRQPDGPEDVPTPRLSEALERLSENVRERELGG